MIRRSMDDIKTDLVEKWLSNMSIEDLREYYIDGSHQYLSEQTNLDTILDAIRYGVDTEITE
jgi:hypothetical protein